MELEVAAPLSSYPALARTTKYIAILLCGTQI
jgi:hypothetical protein